MNSIKNDNENTKEPTAEDVDNILNELLGENTVKRKDICGNEECNEECNNNIENYPKGEITQFKPFETIPISTISFIAHTNLEIDINKAFIYFTIDPTKYIKNPKKRNKDYKYESGSIISVKYKDTVRGIYNKTKKRNPRPNKQHTSTKKKKYNYFLHTLQLTMILEDNKIIGVKVPKTGNFHITGVKSEKHYYQAFEYILAALRRCEEISGEKIIFIKDKIGNKEYIKEDSQINVRFQTIMTNIGHTIGYKIKRDALDTYLNNETELFTSEYRPDKNPSIKVKILIPKEIEYHPDLIEVQYNINGTHGESKIYPYKLFFNELRDEIKKKILKPKHFSFLVFQSGKYILSAVGPWMKTAYNLFMKITIDNRKDFEEVINIATTTPNTPIEKD